MSDQLTFDAPKFSDEQAALLGDLGEGPVAWQLDDDEEAGDE
jgi:hypothetical protein